MQTLSKWLVGGLVFLTLLGGCSKSEEELLKEQKAVAEKKETEKKQAQDNKITIRRENYVWDKLTESYDYYSVLGESPNLFGFMFEGSSHYREREYALIYDINTTDFLELCHPENETEYEKSKGPFGRGSNIDCAIVHRADSLTYTKSLPDHDYSKPKDRSDIAQIYIRYHSDFGKEDLLIALRSGKGIPETDRKILLEMFKYAKQPDIEGKLMDGKPVILSEDDLKEFRKIKDEKEKEKFLKKKSPAGYGGETFIGRYDNYHYDKGVSTPYFSRSGSGQGYGTDNGYFTAETIINPELEKIIAEIIKKNLPSVVFETNPFLRLKSFDEIYKNSEDYGLIKIKDKFDLPGALKLNK